MKFEKVLSLRISESGDQRGLPSWGRVGVAIAVGVALIELGVATRVLEAVDFRAASAASGSAKM